MVARHWLQSTQQGGLQVTPCLIGRQFSSRSLNHRSVCSLTDFLNARLFAHHQQDRAASATTKTYHHNFPYPTVMTDQTHHDFQARSPRSQTQRLDRARSPAKLVNDRPQVRFCASTSCLPLPDTDQANRKSSSELQQSQDPMARSKWAFALMMAPTVWTLLCTASRPSVMPQRHSQTLSS